MTTDVENKLIAGFITEFLEYTVVAMYEDELILNRKLVKQYATNLQKESLIPL